MSLFSLCPALSSHPLLGAVDAQTVDRYLSAESLTLVSAEAGEAICSAEGRPLCVGILIHGRATISVAEGEKQVLLRTVRSGELFGIATLFCSERDIHTQIEAQASCSVAFPDPEAMRRLILGEPAATEAFLRMMAGRVTYLNRKIATFTAGSAERRLSLFLCENEQDGTYVSPVSLSALAESLDIGRASLYRAFDRLEAEGFIQKKDKTVTLLDREGMTAKYFGGNDAV